MAGRKPWALLAFLLLESTGPSRRELADRALPEADDPLAAVRWALLQVRRSIAPALVVEVDGRFTIADRARFEVDVDALVSGRADPANVDVLAGGELLEGFAFDEAPDLDRWLTLQRSRLRSASAETLLWAATVLAPTDPGRAGVLAERAAALDPFDDAIHELIVDCHVRQGDRRGPVPTSSGSHTSTEPNSGSTRRPRSHVRWNVPRVRAVGPARGRCRVRRWPVQSRHGSSWILHGSGSKPATMARRSGSGVGRPRMLPRAATWRSKPGRPSSLGRRSRTRSAVAIGRLRSCCGVPCSSRGRSEIGSSPPKSNARPATSISWPQTTGRPKPPSAGRSPSGARSVTGSRSGAR